MQGAERDAVRAHHPPGYFCPGRRADRLVAAAKASADFASLGLALNPRYYFRFDDPEPDNKSVFLHHAPDERWPYTACRWLSMSARLLSLAFSDPGRRAHISGPPR